MVKKITVLIAVLFLLSCALSTSGVIKVDPQIMKKKYDKMFSAAIKEGAKMSYSIEYQDKQNGLLKLSHIVMKNTYRIEVHFGSDNFYVIGSVSDDIVNPFINNDAKRIVAAIKAATQ